MKKTFYLELEVIQCRIDDEDYPVGLLKIKNANKEEIAAPPFLTFEKGQEWLSILKESGNPDSLKKTLEDLEKNFQKTADDNIQSLEERLYEKYHQNKEGTLNLIKIVRQIFIETTALTLRQLERLAPQN